MLPLSDGLPARRFPVVNILLIVANFAVFLFYELPQLHTAGFFPRRNRGDQTPVAKMRTGAGSGKIRVAITYQY